MLCPKYEEIGSLRRCTILPNPCHLLPLLPWAHILKLWGQSEPFSLSCSSSSQAGLLIMCDIGSLPELFFLSVPPQILRYCVQGCLYINLSLMYNYFSRSLILTNCIQHSSLFCLMRKRSAAWWTGPPRAFMEVIGGWFLCWGRAEQNLHPVSLSV